MCLCLDNKWFALCTHQTQWTDLGGQGGSGSDLSADAPHVHCKVREGRGGLALTDTHTWDTSNFGGAFLRLPRTELDLIGIELGRHGDCVVVCTVSSCKENADCE